MISIQVFPSKTIKLKHKAVAIVFDRVKDTGYDIFNFLMSLINSDNNFVLHLIIFKLESANDKNINVS